MGDWHLTWVRGLVLFVQCDLVFRNYLQPLRDVYKRFSGRGKLPGETPTMSFDEYMEFVSVAELYVPRCAATPPPCLTLLFATCVLVAATTTPSWSVRPGWRLCCP